VIIPIERRGARPVFRQIVDYLRRAIEAGRLEPGTKLQPIRLLAKELGLNRETVADAYRELEALGLTESGVGRGTFVLPRPSQAVEPAAALRSPERAYVPMFSRTAESVPPHPLVDYTAGPKALRLERLVPDPRLYPVDEFRKALGRALQRGGASLLEYGDPRGHESLRRVLVERLAHSGIEADADDVVITGGSTQGLAIVVRLFCDPGDGVVVECPTYPGTLGMLRAAGLRALPVPLTPTGLDLDALDALLGRGGARLLYTMPSFQNPTGISTSIEHRRRLLEITARHGIPVLEDDFEKDLRVRGRPTPPLKALDRTGNVVYVGTFSKALFPGVRVGWIVGGRRVAAAAVTFKHALDLATSPVLQAGLATFCRAGGYDRHVRRVAKEVERRLARAFTALERHLPDGSTFARPDGGLTVWVTLPDAIDTLALLPAAREAGIVYAPGQLFFPDGRRSSALRLSIAQVSPDEVERAARILGEVARAAMPQRRTNRSSHDNGPRVHV
jgi:GntR family transcriptional regulator/MocR family aminotransferase